MGNKNSFNPLPKYEQAFQQLSLADAAELKTKFKTLSGGSDGISLDAFCRLSPVMNSSYFRKYIFPKYFYALDFKRDGTLDQEEFMCAVAFFRSASVEDHIRFLFLMYDTGKVSSGGYLSKDNLRQLIVDSTIAAQKEDIPLQNLEFWIQNMAQLSEAMVETALVQFGSSIGRMDVNDFIAYVKVEGTIQALLASFPVYLGEPPLQHR